jgi:cysteine desulfurase
MKYKQNILKEIRPETKLICFSYVNSETGTIQEVRKIVLAVREFCKSKNWEVPKIFVDATQAVLYENLDVSTLLVDGMSFGGGKIGSVPGAAVLYVRTGCKLAPIISGGGQEEGFRSGTENLPAIVSLSEVLEKVKEEEKEKREKVYELRNYCIQKLEENFSETELEIFGDTKFKYNKFFEHAAPHILLISLVDMLGEETLLRLDAKGISVSTASACSLLENSGSNFLRSIGEPVKAKETIRLSFSAENTKKEIDYFVKVLKDIKNKFIK